ncbi:MAG: prephenate dehydratase [Oscillatoria sp. PMC 1068.18]|nr:prephenate dehydratase [Oscillatoria sp. PMC 1076.18]MEC4988374.1 prephenate dehydratase [Oscillatoria sp. PMC 1068.18]
MTISIAYLGPSGTYAEAAALAYANWLKTETKQESLLCPYPSIAQTLHSVTEQQADIAVVPVENSIQGNVASTLDTVWELDGLQIQHALVLPVEHALLSHAKSLTDLETVYSHPQALGQCQKWLERLGAKVQLVPTNSTTEALQYLDKELTAAAIASIRASQLYNLPILASDINDYPDNCTRFWVLGLSRLTSGSYISLAFSVPANVPGALVKPLSVFAQREINLTRIESRPTKRSLGEYLFFIDLEGNGEKTSTQAALQELTAYTEVLKIFGNYDILPMRLTKS